MLGSKTREIENLKAQLEEKETNIKQRDRLIKDLKEKQEEDLNYIRANAGEYIEYLETSICSAKQASTGKGTVVERLDNVRAILCSCKFR